MGENTKHSLGVHLSGWISEVQDWEMCVLDGSRNIIFAQCVNRFPYMTQRFKHCTRTKNSKTPWICWYWIKDPLFPINSVVILVNSKFCFILPFNNCLINYFYGQKIFVGRSWMRRSPASNCGTGSILGKRTRSATIPSRMYGSRLIIVIKQQCYWSHGR